MKPHYLLKTAQAALLTSLPSISFAACIGKPVYSALPNIPNPGDDDFDVSPPLIVTPNFGSWVHAHTQISTWDCDAYSTNNALSGTNSRIPTGQMSDASNLSTPGQDNLGRPIDLKSNVTAMQQQFGGGISILRRNKGYARGRASLSDTLWIDKPGAADTELTHIPIELCFYYSSIWATQTTPPASVAGALVQLYDFNYNGGANADSFTLDNSISAADTGVGGGEACTSGTINMVGPGDGVKLRLIVGNNGQVGNEYHVPTNSYMQTYQGIATARFRITSLPPGVTCKSASGVFPGCGGSFDGNESTKVADEVPEKEPDAECKNPCKCPTQDALVDHTKTQANPINIAAGFKTQSETDYVGSDLSFSRIYRSDADWFSHSVGQNWRHNFDRNLTFGTSPETQTIAITTNMGTVETFRKNYSGTWEPIDLDITSRLEETATEYIYTRGGTSGTKEHFDLDGKLLRIVPTGGHALDLSYNASGQLETVSDEQEQSITLSYNPQGKVSTLTTPDGDFTYNYDANGNLSSVTNPDTTTRGYHYEDVNFPHALTGITDENNVRYVTWSYNSEGKAISSEHAGGVDHYTITYNPDETTTVTNPLGKQTTYTFETIQGVRKIIGVEGHQSANCAAGSREYSYTPEGWLDLRTDWEGHVTDFDYDGSGLVTAITRDADGPDERTTGITYTPDLRLVDIISETGRTTDYGYDAYGRVMSIAVTDTSTAETRTTGYTYYPNSMNGNGDIVLGRVHTVDGPRSDVNDVTTYGYDANNRLASITNALGHTTQITNYDPADRPQTIIDPNNIQTQLSYDMAGRLETITKAYGTALATTTTLGYDNVGNLETITLPGNIQLTYSYDGARRLTGVEDNSGNTITYTLDDAGNRTGEDIRDSQGTLTYTNTKVFDELSRLIEVVDANTDSTFFSYDLNGNLRQHTDANTNPTIYAYDGLNRLVSSTDALQGQTILSRNALDQLEGVTDPRNNETRYTYNAFGDLTQLISPDTGTTTYTHDPAGNRTSQLDARSVLTNYSFDAINRISTISYPSAPAQDVTLTYDAAGCGASIGRLCTVIDAAGSASYVYDDLGRVTSASKVRSSNTFNTGYAYGADGNLETLTLPSGRTVTYGRDANGQISSVSADVNGSSQALASNIAYLPFGPLESMSYGNGLTLNVSYDHDYELQNRSISGVSNVPYAHDPAGNITTKGDTTYSYDNLNRLDVEFNALTNDTIDYDHDAIGNRIAETLNGSTSIYAYSLTSSWLNSIDSEMHTYDQAGNMDTDQSGNRVFTYNAAGRLAQVDDLSGTLGQYTYDANGQRSRKTTASGTTQFIFGAGGQLLGEYDVSGGMIREYVYLNGEPLAQINDDESVLYLHTDHLATPRTATNQTGTQVWRWESDAFGRSAPSGSEIVNLRFAGQYYDTETALHYNWNRYYNPETGRYITSDPIGLEGGLNTYAYVEGSPIMFVDPEGLKTQAERDKEADEYMKTQRERGKAFARLICMFADKVTGMNSDSYKKLNPILKKFINKYGCRAGVEKFYELSAKLKADLIRKGIEDCGPYGPADGKSCQPYDPLPDETKENSCPIPGNWPQNITIPPNPKVYDDIQQMKPGILTDPTPQKQTDDTEDGLPIM